MDPNLLRPSLHDDRPRRPLFSTTACWLTAFFGGIGAAAAIYGINAARAGRAQREAPWIIGGAFAAIIALVLWDWTLQPESLTPDAFRLGQRALAIMLALLWQWRLRASFGAQELSGIAPPSPWAMAIGSIVFGGLLSVALGLLLEVRR